MRDDLLRGQRSRCNRIQIHVISRATAPEQGTYQLIRINNTRSAYHSVQAKSPEVTAVEFDENVIFESGANAMGVYE